MLFIILYFRDFQFKRAIESLDWQGFLIIFIRNKSELLREEESQVSQSFFRLPPSARKNQDLAGALGVAGYMQ
jgi:hypothetical protein